MDFPSFKESINSSFGGLNPLLRIYEREWVDDTIRILNEEDEGCHEHEPVRIFTVPQKLISTKKEAYIPQLVAIGPYHQKRLDLYQMMRYKISSAKRYQKILKTHKIKDVVEHFCKLEHRIRACYHMFIDYSAETFAWTMAIDASFLSEYLQIYAKGVAFTEIPYRMSHLVDYTGRKSGHRGILKDMIMMENQIPLFVLREFLGFCELESPDEFLANGLKGLCRDLSPVNFGNDFPLRKDEVMGRAHFLELLYHTIVPSSNEAGVAVEKVDDGKERHNGEENSRKKAFKSVVEKLSFVMLAPIHYLNKAAASKKFSIMVKLPCAIIKKLTAKSTAVEIQDFVESTEEITQEIEDADSQDAPQIVDIPIPRVTELSDVGIRFRPTKGGLNTLKFDKATATFSLPVIKMDEKSDVVLRNLIAYEAAVAPEMMTLSRYVEFMNGIIDTKEDVKLLRESGIIFNYLKSDEEVANLWNGMNTGSRTTTAVPLLDGAIDSVNAYYSSKLKVQAARIMKKKLFWKFLILMGANILLLLNALQAFCSVYNCKRTLSL